MKKYKVVFTQSVLETDYKKKTTLETKLGYKNILSRVADLAVYNSESQSGKMIILESESSNFGYSYSIKFNRINSIIKSYKRYTPISNSIRRARDLNLRA